MDYSQKLIRPVRIGQGPAAVPAVGGLFLVCIFSSLALQGWLIFVQEFNWDEFYFLSLVHDHLRGELDKALQTIHVHLFAALAAVPGNEIDQLIAGRLVMLTLQMASFGGLYLVARTFVEREPALFALLAFATMANTLQHGASFRADPLALALLMAALAVLARAPLRLPVVGGIGTLLAFAGMVTVKSAFFAPAFVGIGLWRLHASENSRSTAARLGATAVLAFALFVLLYLLHDMTLPAADLSGSEAMLTGAGSTTLLAGFVPRREYIVNAIATSPVQFLLMAGALILLCAAVVRNRGDRRWESIACLGCALPLASLLFYRNAFPYFFPFISAPAFIAVAWLVRQRRWNALVLGALAAAMIATASLSLARIAARGQSAQVSVVAAVHEIFPQPVNYIDRGSMIASFPKRGFFMSTWGMLDYHKRAPVFTRLLESTPVPLLIVNGPALEDAMNSAGTVEALALHREDEAALRENYIPHWGPVWVAGKRLRLGTRPGDLTILVPGVYTLEGAAAVIDGHEVRPDQPVMLYRGTHSISGKPGATITLRWGNRLRRPMRPPPSEPLFQGF